jgi:hypothetical protein
VDQLSHVDPSLILRRAFSPAFKIDQMSRPESGQYCSLPANLCRQQGGRFRQG